jgi:hypothetical protein
MTSSTVNQHASGSGGTFRAAAQRHFIGIIPAGRGGENDWVVSRFYEDA